MTIAGSKNDVEWEIAEDACSCSECGATIQPGDQIAHWTERGRASFGIPFCIERHYCEDCGHLLEDSLTTTEEA